MRGIGTSFRAIAIGIPLVVATVSNEEVGIAAAIVYALAYTVELAVSLLSYFGTGLGMTPPRLATALFLVLPSVALAASETREEEFDPAHEWEFKAWVGTARARRQQGRRVPDARHDRQLRARHRADARQGREGRPSARRSAR